MEAAGKLSAHMHGVLRASFNEGIAKNALVARVQAAGIEGLPLLAGDYPAISPIAPFGGFNQSGYVREAGKEAIADYMRTKTTWINTSEAPMANPFVMR